MPTNAEIVKTVTDALGRGDLLAVMGLVAKDVRWAVNAADREAAPWFRVYEGKRSLPDFFAELAQVTFSDFTLRASSSGGSVGPVRSVQSGSAIRTRVARVTLVARVTGIAGITFVAGVTGIALFALVAGVPGITLVSLAAGGAVISLFALVSGVALVALVSLVTRSALSAGRTGAGSETKSHRDKCTKNQIFHHIRSC